MLSPAPPLSIRTGDVTPDARWQGGQGQPPAGSARWGGGKGWERGEEGSFSIVRVASSDSKKETIGSGWVGEGEGGCREIWCTPRGAETQREKALGRRGWGLGTEIAEGRGERSVARFRKGKGRAFAERRGGGVEERLTRESQRPHDVYLPSSHSFFLPGTFLQVVTPPRHASKGWP